MPETNPCASCAEGESQWQPGLRFPQGWGVGCGRTWHHGAPTAPGAAQAFRVVSVGSAPGEELPVPWQHSRSFEVTTGGRLVHRIAIMRCFNAIYIEIYGFESA